MVIFIKKNNKDVFVQMRPKNGMINFNLLKNRINLTRSI